MMFRAVTIIALAGLASAQVQISSQCQSALTSIVANSDANACLSPTSLLPLATSSNTSIVGPITAWTKNVCSADPCSNQTLSDIVNSLVNGCQSEISSSASGVDPSTLASQITPIVQQYYPTVRKIVCLEDNNNNCIAQTLDNIQNMLGPLSIQNILNIALLHNVTTLPSNLSCTDCSKAAYNILHTDLPSVAAVATPDLQQQCGASFTDGSNPAGITEIAADNASGAATLATSVLGVSALAIISTFATLL